MTSFLSTGHDRRAALLVLVLCVGIAGSVIPLDRPYARTAAFGSRASVGGVPGVLSHVGARGGLHTAALGRGAAASTLASPHALESVRASRALRARRVVVPELAELSAVRDPRPRSRASDVAPHRSRVSSAATPRAPPRV